MKKRFITSLVAGGLLAATLPGVAAAQTDNDVALTFALNATCEFGQGSDMAPCGPDEDGNPMVLTFSNPQSASGAMNGIAVLNGRFIPNGEDGTFTTSGSAFFAGEVEGCGSGTLNLDYAGNGIMNEDGSNTFESDVYTIVPGGSLPVTGSYEQTVPDAQNDDGTTTAIYAASLTC